MRRPIQLHFQFYRVSLVSLVALVAPLICGELNSSFVRANRASAANSKSFSASDSIATYRWNLNDEDLPLISLPDHVDASIELSLTYSMEQFQFPLFQSLYYNQQARKYILMLIPGDGRRAEFVYLDASEKYQIETNSSSGLRLTDAGQVKLLTSSEGAVYAFAPLADGELHCMQIKDRNGVVIKLNYTAAASIDTIADARGRTIAFNYTNDYVSSITQTWKMSSVKLRKTWAVTTDSPVKTPPFTADLIGGTATVKHIPTNATKPAYTEAMAASDSYLASVFGGAGALAAANGFEPPNLGTPYPLYRGDLIDDDGQIRRGHLSYAMHLYGSADGTGKTEIYVPLGFTSHSGTPTPTDAAVTFYYPRLGNLTDVTLAVFHVDNFHLSYEDYRVRIGDIGGPGGSVVSYRHSHLEFYHGNTGLPPAKMRAGLRIDPTSVFETPQPSGIALSPR